MLTVVNTNDSFTGSLRQAIISANPAGGDTIVFQIPSTDPGYNSTTGIWTVGLTSGELVIDKSLAIDGSAQKISIRRTSGGFFRIFRVTAGTTVSLNDLGISNGTAIAAAGIDNSGDLSLRNCTLYDNRVPLEGARGGAIQTSGTLRVSNCTFTANSAIEGTTIFGLGPVTIENTTISGNSTGSWAVDISSATPARVRNTIIVGNGGDVRGTFISEGYNLIGSQAGGTTGFGAMGDQLGVTAAQVNLTSLQDNGGNTLTRRPLPGSLAIDQGKRGVDGNNQPINTDQRRLPRPIDLPGVANAIGGDGSDVGAVEVGTVQTGPAFTVTIAAERNDGSCTTDDCTLLEALNVTNSNPDANTISFASGIGSIITTNQLTPSGLTISNPVTINGPGARYLAISGGGVARVFQVTGANVLISGLTIAAGQTSGDNGGAIRNTGGLTLQDCTVSHSYAPGGEPVGRGGGIYNASGATLILTGCTIQYCHASVFGGGVYSDGTLSATNCTFTGNTALRGGGLISRAAGGAAMMTLRNCTIADNHATDGVAMPGFGGGGVFAEGNNTQYFAANNLIAGNSATNDPDIRGNYTSQGNNLIGTIGDASGFAHGVNGDKVGTVAAPLNAQFGSFGANGGHTGTWSLLASSPAINAGNDTLAPATDQRGFGRSGISDIGAFEFNGVPLPVQLVSAVSRKTHGNIGAFDIPLALAGNPTVECRSGGVNGDYTVIFGFTNRVASVGSASVTSGTGLVSSSQSGFDSRQYVVNLSGVSNAQRITVTLFNVTDSLGYNSSALPLTLGFLLGDTNGNGSVTASDIAQAKAQAGHPLTAANFRTDVNVSGSVSASDIGLVKSVAGSQLPARAGEEDTSSRSTKPALE